jgi:ABC-type lipoprotein release transport system permease subunit
VVFAVLIAVVMRSLQGGTYEALQRETISMVTAELQIQDEAYLDDPGLAHPIWADQVSAAALDDPRIRFAEWRIEGFGLVSSEEHSAAAQILGIGPAQKDHLSFFRDVDEMQPGRAWIGSALAENLALSIGDSLVVITQGYQNMMGAEIFAVAGTITTGSTEADRGLVVIAYEDAQDLFALWGGATMMVVGTKDFHDAASVAEDVSASLEGSNLVAHPWARLMPELEQMIQMDDASGVIFLVFLLMLVGFEVLNTTLMSVMERTKEFGVIQAVGLRPFHLAILIALELLMRLLVSLALAMALLIPLLWVLSNTPIPIPPELLEVYQSFGIQVSEIRFSVRSSVWTIPVVAMFVIGLFSIIPPIVRLYRLNLIDALRN